MGIHTEKPGGGEDLITVYRANSAEDARRARTALETAGVPVDLPDQAIDAIYATKPDAELTVKVQLKHSGKALKALKDVVRKEPESPILAADDRNKAAEESLAAAPAPAPVSDPTVIPATAVDKDAKRAFIVSCASIMFPPVGIVGGFWGASVLMEMLKRPKDEFRGKTHAKIATFLGFATFLMGTPFLIIGWRAMHKAP